MCAFEGFLGRKTALNETTMSNSTECRINKSIKKHNENMTEVMRFLFYFKKNMEGTSSPVVPLGCLCRWTVSRWVPGLCRLQSHPALTELFLCAFNISKTNFQHNELTKNGRKSMNVTHARLETAWICSSECFIQTVLQETYFNLNEKYLCTFEKKKIIINIWVSPPVEFILTRMWSPPGLTIADITSCTDVFTGSIRVRGLLSGL